MPKRSAVLARSLPLAIVFAALAAQPGCVQQPTAAVAPATPGRFYLIIDLLGPDAESARAAADFLAERKLPVVVDTYDAGRFYLRSADGWDFAIAAQRASAEAFRDKVLDAGSAYRQAAPDSAALRFGETSNQPYFYQF